ncbi:MAG: hypothetical protein KDA80_13415 [Planctomycetaceae bacterium]|nr:hypothetical protein [Planctomycetaceae bacterium]
MERKASGQVTVLRCRCQEPYPVMKLIEPKRVVRPVGVPLNKYIDAEELEALLDEEAETEGGTVSPSPSTETHTVVEERPPSSPTEKNEL